MSQGRWLGIDFSGNVKQWSATKKNSNVWVAEVQGQDSGLHLVGLRRVQDLPGQAPPFERLATLLGGTFSAAGIDAPFSVPGAVVQDHRAFLRLVGQSKPPRCTFVSGNEFVVAVTGQPPPLSPHKPLRATEARWIRTGSVRSTLWWKPRGGAPMTACLTLLDLVGGPVWPFTRTAASLLVEAFPAA